MLGVCIHKQLEESSEFFNHREHRGHRDGPFFLCALCVLCGYFFV
jgi:hypothetical protein